MIFEELVLAPLIPGRVAKTREELLAMFPGQPPGFLDNRLTTVKRVFRRILPALVPADPTENLTPEERFQELLEILHASKNNRLWLAFLTKPAAGPEESTGSSLELAAASSGEEMPEAMISPEVLHDELRVLLGFWLEMPLNDYLDDLDGAGPTVARALKDCAAAGPLGLARNAATCPQLEWADRRVASHDRGHPARRADDGARAAQDIRKARPPRGKAGREKRKPGGAARRENSMPLEIAQVLYDLAGALALTRRGARIVGLSDDRYRKNVFWLLNQPWLDTRLRPVFAAALKQLDVDRRE